MRATINPQGRQSHRTMGEQGLVQGHHHIRDDNAIPTYC